MADNVEFQAILPATPAKGTVVAAYDRDGVLYQRFIEGFDYALYFYDGSGNLVYRCIHHNAGAATSETDWLITKYTYSSGNLSKSETLSGSVDGRAALGWS